MSLKVLLCARCNQRPVKCRCLHEGDQREVYEVEVWTPKEIEEGVNRLLDKLVGAAPSLAPNAVPYRKDPLRHMRKPDTGRSAKPHRGQGSHPPREPDSC